MSSRVPVLLMDYGGPSADLAEVRAYLTRLFSDPVILPVPWGLRHTLARFIAWRRAPHSLKKYQSIDGSPVPAEVESLRQALQAELGEAYEVHTAFRYGPPLVQDVVEELISAGHDHVVVAPTFPQWSAATWGTFLGAIHGIDATPITPWGEDEGLVDALVATMEPMVGQDTHVLFTAHGLPQKMVDRGDPYADQIQATAEAVGARLPCPWSLAFQSRLGPVEWLRPYMEEEIARLGEAGVEHLVVSPLSFSTENLETRWDLDREAAEAAAQAGISRYDRAPAPGAALAPVLAQRVREVSP